MGLLNILEERDVQIRGFTFACRSTCTWSHPPTRRTTRRAAGSSRRSRTGSGRRSGPTTRGRSTHEMAIVRQEKQRFGDRRRRCRPDRRRAARSWRSSSPSSPTSPAAPRRSASAPACQRPGLGGEHGGPRGRCAQAGGPARRDRSAAPRVSDLGAVIASTVGKVELEIGRRRRARGAGRRAAHHEGALRDVQPPRRPRRPRRRSSRRSRTASSSRPASGRRRASTSRGCARCRASATRSARLGAFDVTDGAEEPAVVASAVEFLLEGLHLARRLNKERDRRAGRSTTGDAPARPDPRQLAATPRTRGPAASRRPPRDGVDGRSPGARATRAGTARSGCRTSTPTRSSTRSSDDVMAEGDLAEALRRLMERGWRSGDPTRPDLRRPAGPHGPPAPGGARSCASATSSATCSATSGAELEEIVAEERAGVERRLDEQRRRPARPTAAGPTPDAAPPTRMLPQDAARRRREAARPARRPAAPTSATGSAACASTTSSSRRRASRFDELVERLGKQVLDQFVAGMSDAIRSMTPEDLAANREMVRDLNELLRERIGGPRTPDARRSSPSTAGSSRARRRSTTSSSSSPSGWRRCSRCCAR